MSSRLLEIRDLSVSFQTQQGVRRAVDTVSFSMGEGETLGLVGESGCGKSVTALSILGLVDSSTGRVESGRILFKGQNLLDIGPEAMRRLRGNNVSMVFQEPMTSLNPILPVGRQIAEPLMTHQGLSKKEAYTSAATWLERVKIPMARKRMKEYPHQLSGGMRQRVMIAMAMVCRPDLLIADEPTTALDVSTQAQILTLIEKLKADLQMSVLFITHDLGVIAQTAKRVVVMYAGQVVETALVCDVFDRPAHPYTKGLLKSIPRMGTPKDGSKNRLQEIRGSLPSLDNPMPGCKFADRCSEVFEPCGQKKPVLLPVQGEQQARCWLFADRI
ncbi:MAG: ABC transporter ATP-binding protein [Desulfobacterales bacterium]|nr:ABC transporter ATP-binding protein [Desulfobacterales bacterium]MDX2510914.1 ABC transporter ATP-binding protein [Desulfobacterales bacterium]